MLKKILLINSEGDTEELFNIFQELKREHFYFSVLSSKNEALLSAKNHGWSSKKLYPIFNPQKHAWFLILLPLYYLFFLPYVAILKWRDHYQIIFCCGFFEKIVFTPLAGLFKIKILWFTYPETALAKEGKMLTALLRRISVWAKIIAPTYTAKQKLIAAGYKEEKIIFIALGANLNLYRHQDNIFSKIATVENHWPQRKFFTIGTVARLEQKQNIETLFNATKKLLDVVPFPQIIIVGDGQERKNLTWLAKKMNIENFVWFVGEQNSLKKWLDTFDIFVVTNSLVKLPDLNILIRAMAAGLPIIGPTNNGLEEIIANNENGVLVEENDSEDLAQAIIKLQQRKDWRRMIGEKNKNKAATEFSIEKTLESFKQLLNR